MLHFILGRAGSGKTTTVHTLLEDYVRAGWQDLILLVPEQYSFYSERAMLERLGAKGAGSVEVLSFSRLAHSVFRLYGGKSGRAIDDAGRAILMSLALDSVGDSLEVYGRHRQSPAVISEMLGLSTELKQGAIAPGEMMDVSDRMQDCLLKKKTREIALVLSAYEALVARSFFDGQDELSNLYDTLLDHVFFAGKVVVIDAFRGFTGQELKVLERILAQSESVYMTLCTDSLYAPAGDTGVFAHTKRTANQIMDIAKKRGIQVAKPLFLPVEGTGGKAAIGDTRHKNEALTALERGLYNPEAVAYEALTDAVTLTAAGDIISECEFVALTIKRLLREEALRCRDIAVIARTAETYEAPLKSALKKCEVPVFIDKRQPIVTQPLIVLVRSAAEIAANGFSLDAVMRCLKTGLAGFAVEDVSMLENYALLWNINGNRWLRAWDAHPGGYGSELTDTDREFLKSLNRLREQVTAPLSKLHGSFENADGQSAATAIFDYLQDVSAGQNLKNLAIALEDEGEPVLALEQERLWDDLMEVLDSVAAALKDKKLNAKRFRELFDLVIATRSLGSIPQGLDEITIGSAGRIRTASPKVVFVVGANEGVFPRTPVSTGILNDLERQELIELGLAVADPAEFKIMEERFIAYTALSSASEQLFVSYARKDLAGAALSASDLVTQVKRLLPGCIKKDTVDIPAMDYVEGVRPAFELTAKLWNKGDSLYATLRAYFNGREDYKNKLEAFDRAVDQKPFEIRDKETAAALFGKNMYISASRVENFYKCAFSYFCKYGLKAEPRKIAELDPMQKGTILHYVLQRLLEKYPGKQIVALTKEQRLAEIKAIMDAYAQEKMGGMQGKEKRFEYLYNRLAAILAEVVNRLVRELENSSFEPVNFELAIDIDGDIPLYEIMLENGGVLKIKGSVDRVDLMLKDGKSYIRVVDYKSSGKKFVLSETLEGVNMQMLIYLFAIWHNGGELYGDVVPAGVLYMPTNAPAANLGRNASLEEIEAEKIKNSRMSGMLLNNMDVVIGMENDGEGIFIPAKLKNDALEGSLITLEEMGKLKTRVDGMISKMAHSLHRGEIPAYPAATDLMHPACIYCDYGPVCGRDSSTPLRFISKLSHEDALRIIDGEGGGTYEVD